jgi:hypothetical protein
MPDLGTRSNGGIRRSGPARARTIRRLLASVAVGGGLALVMTASAYGAATMTITPNTGLNPGQQVTITGTGWTKNAIGNFLECSTAGGSAQPTVALPAPVSNAVSVSCNAPSYGHLETIGADGSLHGTFTIIGGTVGPPCGTTGAVITTCPATDSTGGSPASDAAKYPCPPTPAQLAAGAYCTISFGDNAPGNENVTLPIHFASEQAATPTTAAPAAPVSTTPPVGPATTAPPATSPTSSTLATTGAGPDLWFMALVGALLTLAGALLWLAPVRRLRRNGKA